jgi:hypothetical protein
MATLTFPSIVPMRTEWALESNTQSFNSPLSRSIQTRELTGSRWLANMIFTDLSNTEARVLAAFLAQLRGQSGRFFLFDHSHSSPRGVGTGSPLVNGASQTGTSLITDGWTPSQTNIMRAGDYVEFNNELKMVVADVNSDGGGNATLTVEPPMRSSPANNAVITVTQATATMMLQDDAQARWVNRPGTFSSFSVSAVEAFQ